ncbi:MAG TPA: hypothetical protein VK816_09460 [Jatrophihabitantaceae bacterium]|nr:hypothetical protein [Jatrophihabitantaceae bacterium]
MNSPLAAARVRLAPVARRWYQQLDNPEVRNARRLAEAVRSAPPDVVYFGESASLFVSGADADQRPLFRMIADELGAGTTVHAIAGAGYHARLFDAYAQLLGAGSWRPVVVLPLWVRGSFTAWTRHPVYGYQHAVRAIRAVDRNAPLWRIRARIGPPGELDWTLHDQLSHPTLIGDLKVGAYRLPLKDPAKYGLDRQARLRLLYAFHHGGAITPDTPYLADVTRFGRTLRELGCPVVAYQTPVPVERGVELFGPAFADLAAANFALMGEAFGRGYGPVGIPPTGTSYASSDFVDPDDGTEHVNEKGRLRLAAEIAGGVSAALAARSQAG